MNYKRKCTEGYSIFGVIPDFGGGVLSMCQTIINCVHVGDWDEMFGNPAKFGLSLVTLAYDLMFMFQHYVLYRGNKKPVLEESRGLLHDVSINENENETHEITGQDEDISDLKKRNRWSTFKLFMLKGYCDEDEYLRNTKEAE
eukprot:TRINITY_DN6197_c0_g1_i1.p3 TRINITY_DN6197_c0_g1~~TRINITY_DN6197_c0_g1_i1.p3  ORF type:complete len:143 (-),score=29.60 TRINITY_DN6197_c0_g1_i1:37-465(-)